MKEIIKNGKSRTVFYSSGFLSLLIQIFCQCYLKGSDIKNNLI